MDEDLQEKLDEISDEISDVKSDMATREDVEAINERLDIIDSKLKDMLKKILSAIDDIDTN